MRLVAQFPQQMMQNALYQYTICTAPQNKFPANAKFAEFRNNQNLRMETLPLRQPPESRKIFENSHPARPVKIVRSAPDFH